MIADFLNKQIFFSGEFPGCDSLQPEQGPLRQPSQICFEAKHLQHKLLINFFATFLQHFLHNFCNNFGYFAKFLETFLLNFLLLFCNTFCNFLETLFLQHFCGTFCYFFATRAATGCFTSHCLLGQKSCALCKGFPSNKKQRRGLFCCTGTVTVYTIGYNECKVWCAQTLR